MVVDINPFSAMNIVVVPFLKYVYFKMTKTYKQREKQIWQPKIRSSKSLYKNMMTNDIFMFNRISIELIQMIDIYITGKSNNIR